MENRYIATMILHAVADTIGFKNGEWEFNYSKSTITLETTLELLFEFIALGGINGIDLKDWRVSDDTIIHIAIAKTLIDTKLNKIKKIKKMTPEMAMSFKVNLVQAYNDIHDDEEKGIERAPGETTNKYIEKFEGGHDGRNLPYDKLSGGNGAAMRCPCIGLAFCGEENRDTLINIAIESSRLTHNSAIGYLGGLTTALFTAWAIEGIDIIKWPFMLIELLNSKKVRKYIKDNQYERDDYDTYINYWKKYIDTRFDDYKPITSRAHNNLIFRSRYNYENFTRDTPSTFIGESGYSATIMAYDSLLDAEDKWEKLIIYAAIHFGDGDTVGAIAGALYGALYGFGDVPVSNLKYLEFKDELNEIGEKLYKKYYRTNEEMNEL